MKIITISPEPHLNDEVGKGRADKNTEKLLYEQVSQDWIDIYRTTMTLNEKTPKLDA